MSRRTQFAVALIKYLPALAILVVGAFYVVTQVDRALRSANLIFSEQLTNRLGRLVRVKQATLTPLGLAELRGVRISKGADLSHGVLAEARRVIIKYDWVALVFGGKGAQSISRVEVYEPDLLLVRSSTGRFNVQDLLRPGPKRPPFLGRIVIYDGKTRFVDYAAKARKLPAVLRVSNVNGTINARAYPTYSFTVWGKGEPSVFSRSRAIGLYNSRQKWLRIDVTASDVSAQKATDYFGLWRSIQPASGRLKVVAGIKMLRDTRWKLQELTGVTDLRGVKTRIVGLSEPIESADGSIAFNGTNAVVSVVGASANSPIRITGAIENFSRPLLDLRVTSHRADFASLARALGIPKALRVSGTGPLSVGVVGRLPRLTITVRARIPDAQIRGVRANDVSLVATYDRGHLTIGSAVFKLMGGQATMTGAVRLSDGARLKLAGRVNNLPLQCVPGIAGVTASGLADVTFAINGPSSSPVVTAGFNVGSGRVDKTRFSSASGEVTYTGNTVHVSRITVLDVFGGRVQARGSLSKSRIGIELAAEGIDLASAGKMARRPDIGGVGYFRGRVSGLLSNPGVTGVLEVFDGRYGKYQIDYLRAAVASDGRRVRVAAGTARLFPAELNFSGILQGLGTDRINVSAKGHVERLTVQQLAELLGRDYSASGAVVGDIQIDGVYARRSETPLSGLVASADLRVEDGKVFGYPISSAKAVAELRDGILTIPELSIVTQEAKLGVAGVYSLDTRAVEGNIHLSDLNLARISDRINAYVTLTGIASAQGTISGLLDAPSLSVGGKITGFTVNGISLDDAYWQADYFDGVVKSAEVGLRRGQQLYSLRVADYNIASNCLTAAVGVVRDALVPDLWDVLIRSPFLGTPEGAGLRQSLSRIPRLTSGVANCSIELRGCLANPDGLLSLTAENVGFDVQKVQRVELVASTKDGVVVLDKALASSGETSLIAVGNPLYANGNVQLDVSAQNLDLQRLRPWLGENTPSGLSSAEFSVTGDVRQPKVVGSIEVVNPSLHGAGFDRLRASRIEVKTDRVEFSDIILAVGKHQAVAQGYLPWDWSNYSVPEDKPLEFSARLNKQDLSIIGKFWKLVETGRTTGDIEAQLDVQGTLVAPSMSGSFKVNKGTVALRGLTSDLTNIDVDIAFDGDKILVNQFTAQSSGGGSLVVQQGSYVTIGNPGEFDVMVSASGLTVSEKNLLGFQEDVVLRVDAGLAIKGPLRSPIVADALGGVPGLLIYDSRLAFLVPEAMPERKQTAFEINPSFNVSIKIGRDVIVAPPNVSLRVAGGGDLTGTLNSPVLKLAMRVDEGSIRLAASRLRVVPGGQIVATYAPPAEPEIRVDFTATSYVTALGPFNRRERYEIILGVSGLAKNMQISLTSKPGGLSRERMLASLGHIEGVFTSGEEGLKQELGNLLTAVGASTLFAPIEALFVERLGFEQFTLEYSSISPLSLFFSTKLFGNFYTSYYQQLLASYANVKDAAWEFRFGYRFKRFYSISVGFTSQEVTDVEIGLVRAFN